MPVWTDGLTAEEAAAQYQDIFFLTALLLTKYNNTGKTFFFGASCHGVWGSRV